MGVLTSGPGDLGQPDQRLDRLDLAEEGLLIGEFVIAPMLKQTLCRRRDAPVRARKLAPGIHMAPNLVDDRVVRVGFEI
jgi:hypothetical protein